MPIHFVQTLLSPPPLALFVRSLEVLSALLSVVEVRSSVEEFTGPGYKSHLINQIASVRYSYNFIITRLPVIVVLLCSQTTIPGIRCHYMHPITLLVVIHPAETWGNLTCLR